MRRRRKAAYPAPARPALPLLYENWKKIYLIQRFLLLRKNLSNVKIRTDYADRRFFCHDILFNQLTNKNNGMKDGRNEEDYPCRSDLGYDFRLSGLRPENSSAEYIGLGAGFRLRSRRFALRSIAFRSISFNPALRAKGP
jgi:hypothetical protein